MNDPDKEVRKLVGECFKQLQPGQLDRMRAFIENFLNSTALLDGAEHLIKYLTPMTVYEHTLPLMTVKRVLDLAGEELIDFRTTRSLLEKDIVRLPLAIYAHAPDEKTRKIALDLFDRLLALGSRTALQALAEWDRA